MKDKSWIGWTIFGCVLVIMTWGSVWLAAASNANIKTNHTININMDQETKESIIEVSKLQKEILELELKKLELEFNLTINSNQSYGKNSTCMYSWHYQEWNPITESYEQTGEKQFDYSNECYLVK